VNSAKNLKKPMSEVKKFTVIATSSRPQHEVIEEMCDRVKEIVYSYAGQVPVATAIGVLHVAAKEILDAQ